jgi:hypothetical protein
LVGSTRSYHENIVEHYENPRNVGALDKNSDDVGTVRLVLSRCHRFLWDSLRRIIIIARVVNVLVVYPLLFFTFTRVRTVTHT